MGILSIFIIYFDFFRIHLIVCCTRKWQSIQNKNLSFLWKTQKTASSFFSIILEMYFVTRTHLNPFFFCTTNKQTNGECIQILKAKEMGWRNCVTLSLFLSLSHTHTHAQTHTHFFSLSHTLSLSLWNIHTQTQTHTLSLSLTISCTQTLFLSFSILLTLSLSHTQTQTLSHSDTRSHTRTHAFSSTTHPFLSFFLFHPPAPHSRAFEQQVNFWWLYQGSIRNKG